MSKYNVEWNNELNLHYGDIADIVRNSLLEKYRGKELKNGWKVVDFEVNYLERWTPGEGEYNDGWSYDEMTIYIISEKKCGKKQVLRKKKELMAL